MEPKKKIYTLAGALLVCAAIFGTMIFSSTRPGQGTLSFISDSGVRTEKQVEKNVAGRKQIPVAANKTATHSNIITAVKYLSAQQEGIIGFYAGSRTDNPADNIFTVNIDRELSPSDKVWLNCELTGVEDLTGVPHSINDRYAMGGYLIKESDKSSLQRERLDPQWLRKGVNSILFSLPENAGYGYKIRNLSIEVERNACASPELVINTSKNGYDNNAYIYGFVQGAKGETAVLIDGRETALVDGAFEAIVSLPENRSANVAATLSNGKKLNRELVYTESAAPDAVFALNNDIKQSEKTFIKGVADEIQLETATLKVDSAGLLANSKNISLSTLRTVDLPPLDMGMTNVTAEREGYRFLPHGENFAKGATVGIKYDRTKIPNGYTEDDIRTFYFDTESRHWEALEKDSLDRRLCMVVSKTTHFTDMINGVIQTPESPETQGFAPTMMNDIKAADPTSKIELISPPTANNRGTAGLSYSFEMPPARNGMQPSLGIQYNSDGGSGLLGEGWDLNIPSISVDTRWGVPRYNDTIETETYMMDGEMLVTMDDSGQPSVAHRGEKIARVADRQFYARNEGAFSRIIRKGNSPGSYTWEVTDKSGTVYTYGGNGAVLAGTVKIRIDTNTVQKPVIARWLLSKVRELHGDSITYTYTTENDSVKGNLKAKAIYLKEVRSGNCSSNTSQTVVNLVYRDSLKVKRTNSARYGFLTSSNKLLDRVEIRFANALLRTYAFDYGMGAFNAETLVAVKHLDQDGKLFAEHTMDYYDDVKSNEGYKPFKEQAETWNTGNDNMRGVFVNPLAHLDIDPHFNSNISALGGTLSQGFDISGYIGVGIAGDMATRGLSAGVSAGYSHNTSTGAIDFVDINGDGLPDKVMRIAGQLFYRPNITKITDTEEKFGNLTPIQGVNSFSMNYGDSYSGGGKVYAGAYGAVAVGGGDFQTSVSTTAVYFADVNGDGLIDIVDHGKVWFNHIEYIGGNAIPKFTPSSADTPSPINNGGTLDNSDTQVDLNEQQSLVSSSPMLDAVRVWQAPFDGMVNISGTVQLQLPTGDYDTDAYGKADGVWVSIQSDNNILWERQINKGETAVYSAIANNVQVSNGQRIYFRVQSGNQELSNGDFDKVTWSPVISYTTGTEYINADGESTTIFKASEGKIVSQANLNRISEDVPVRVHGNFVKPVTSDSIFLKVIASNNDVNDDGTDNPAWQKQEVYSRAFAGNETYNGDLPFDVSNDFGGLNYEMKVVANTNVAWDKVSWQPYMQYTTSIGSNNDQVAVVSYSIFAFYLQHGTPYLAANDTVISVMPEIIWNDLLPVPESGEITVAVKNTTGLLSKKTYVINGGILSPNTPIDSIRTPQGAVWVECSTSDVLLAVSTKSVKAQITLKDQAAPPPASQLILTDLYTIRPDDGFGPMYRGWGQFVYNCAEDRYSKPIDETLLQLPTDSASANILTAPFVMMTPDGTTGSFWTGINSSVYINGDTVSSARFGMQDVVLTNPFDGLSSSNTADGSCLQGTGATAPNLVTKSNSTDKMGGVVGFTANTATGSSRTITAFMDMNGDGFPDWISENQIQLSNTKGGRDGEIVRGIKNQNSINNSMGGGYGGGPKHSYTTISSINKAQNDAERKKIAAEKAKDNAFTVSLSSSTNADGGQQSFIDINGDGLPDMVSLPDHTVKFNLGYGFTDAVAYDFDFIEGGTATSYGTGVGVDFGASSIQAGYGNTITTSNTECTFIDVNSDGLPDMVSTSNGKVMVALNNGNSFGTPFQWQGADKIGVSISIAEAVNAAVTFNPNFLGIKISIGPNTSGSHSISKTNFAIRDVDGDGYPEIVTSDDDASMQVYRSTIARTNKLKSVYNPLGGSFTLDYAHSQATYDHPGGKWVLSSVETDDGLADDGANMKTVFNYSGGKQDRHEREFLGFGHVETINLDTENDSTVYRKAIQEYDVQNVYTAGNEIRSAVEDADGKLYTENINEYYSYEVLAAGDNYTFNENNAICSDHAIAFAPLKYSKSVVYEGQTTGMVANETFYSYYLNGNHGELKNYIYSDKGNLGNQGTGNFNYRTVIVYTDNPEKHIFGLPLKMQVQGSGITVYRQTEAAYDMNYANHLTKITQTVVWGLGGKTAVTDIEYDIYGNITKKTLPANYKGERMSYKYKYDYDYNMYLTRIDDTLGYHSNIEDYDYRFGIPLTTIDINGFTQETKIDNKGRIISILSPKEGAIDGIDHTIKFVYDSLPAIPKGGSTPWEGLRWASTGHYDMQHPGNDIETVTFVDGFGRPVQVKKDGVIYENGADKEVMIVSGRTKYDPFGRVKEAFYPVTELQGNKTVFNPAFDAVTPTKTEYDVLDRVVKVTLPDNSSTKTVYAQNSVERVLCDTLIDAKGGRQAKFTNGSGLTVKTEQYSGPDSTITTRFEYDPINQLLKAIDNGGNATTSTYDMLGRRTSVNHPVSGRTSFAYDNAGNLRSKQTPNLIFKNNKLSEDFHIADSAICEPGGLIPMSSPIINPNVPNNGNNEYAVSTEDTVLYITYDYNFNRLTAIHYPLHPENDVHYTYGNKNALNGCKGRIMLQEDGSGAQEFQYDQLGNIKSIVRTLIIPNQAVATYKMQWTYDSWNRLLTMTYPDEEKVTYSYNTGGLLDKVTGYKSYSYNYVTKLGYDKFEQRTYMKYCNGAETNYTYDDQRRRLSNLSVVSNKTGSQIMNNAYSYDAVDNVLSVVNSAPSNHMSHNYSYDGLYRLISATGADTISGSKTANYSLEMSYDNLYNITSKKQLIQQNGIQFNGILKAGYELNYNYAKNPFQINTLTDENYRTEGNAANDMTNQTHIYKYDANGNLIYVNTAREKADGSQEEKSTERKLLWDEENRLEAIDDNGFVSNYWYDAAGERVVKESGGSDQMYVNGTFSGGNTETTKFTAYVNPYMVVTPGSNYTKHFYIGSQRIVSKIGDLGSYTDDPRRIDYAGVESNIPVDYAEKYRSSLEQIKNRYAAFDVPYNGVDNDDYVYGQGFCCGDSSQQSSPFRAEMANDKPELFQYYYHSDHLGSTSLITDLDGNVAQHVEYVPFGEVFVEERNNKWNTPYLFNAKELDEETGLYYYGARYYNPRTGLWLSTDQMQEKYPNVSTYAYCHDNPVKFIDPNGKTDYGVNEKGYIFKLNPFKDWFRNTFIKEDKTDKLFKVDGTTNEVDKTIKPVEVKVGTLETYKEKSVNVKNQKDPVIGNTITAHDSQEAEKLYNFLKINTDVEWSNIAYNDWKGNILGTSHKNGEEYMHNSLLKEILDAGFSLQQSSHSHNYDHSLDNSNLLVTMLKSQNDEDTKQRLEKEYPTQTQFTIWEYYDCREKESKVY